MRTIILSALFVCAIGFARTGVKVEATAYAIRSGLLTSVFAKELCSCMWVDHLTQKECEKRDNLPAIAHVVIKVSPGERPNSLVAEFDPPLVGHYFGDVEIAPAVTAEYVNDRIGCRIGEGALN